MSTARDQGIASELLALGWAAAKVGDQDAARQVLALTDQSTSLFGVFALAQTQAQIDLLGTQLAAQLQGVNPLDMDLGAFQPASPQDNNALAGVPPPVITDAIKGGALVAADAVGSAIDKVESALSATAWTALVVLLLVLAIVVYAGKAKA